MSAKIVGIDLAGYIIGDADRSIAFYRDVLGMTPTEVSEGRGAEFTLSDGSTFGVWKLDEGQKTSGGAVMFAVEDAQAAVDEFRARGAKLSDPQETDICFMAFGDDPDGNTIIVHQRKTNGESKPA